MKDYTQYKPTEAFSLLLIGPSGSGKTTAALSAMPSPFIADCDNNLVGPVYMLKERGIVKPWYFSTIDNEEKRPANRWKYLCKVCAEALNDDNVDSVIVDSLSKLTDYLIDHILALSGNTTMSQPDWGVFKRTLPNFLTEIKSAGKPVMVIAHDNWDSDKVTGAMQFRVNIPGSNKHDLPRHFGNYWRAEAKPVSVKDANGKVVGKEIKYLVRTAPHEDGSFKRSFSCPNLCEFTPELLKDVLKVKVRKDDDE